MLITREHKKNEQKEYLIFINIEDQWNKTPSKKRFKR